MRCELVIFDCDGVLVDSEPIAARVFSEMVTRLGLPLSPHQVDEQFRGRSLPDCQRLLEQRLGRGLGPNFLDELNRASFEAFARELRPVPGIEGVLRVIQSAGLATCVASSGSHEKMQFTLSHTGLLPLLRGRLFSASEVEQGKPAPDLVLHAAASLNVAPQRTVVVEDSLVGATGAVRAGARVLGYVGGAGARKSEHRDAFLRLGAVPFDEMTELPSLLNLAPDVGLSSRLP